MLFYVYVSPLDIATLPTTFQRLSTRHFVLPVVRTAWQRFAITFRLPHCIHRLLGRKCSTVLPFSHRSICFKPKEGLNGLHERVLGYLPLGKPLNGYINVEILH